jgi:hypothetical protein
MAEQSRPASNDQAPDPARSYERAKPDMESGMGRLDNNNSTPTNRPDLVKKAVTHRQKNRQINADDKAQTDQRADAPPSPDEPDHSMLDEEPLGEDQAPTDVHDPRQKRHPRTEGKGGTP